MRLLIQGLLLACSLSFAQQPLLWKDPGDVAALDLAGGPLGRAGAPRPPFRFLAIDETGTQPKIAVRDRTGREWTAKFGIEVKAETFSTRLVWAMGYYVEPIYYVRSGRFIGVTDPGKADKFVTPKGYFRDARFELRKTSLGQYSEQYDWTWKKNPFLDTPELDGLKILVMLTSNYDNKDARDQRQGSNTAIFERGEGDSREWVYAVSDWGATMGKWGNFFTWEKWDCKGYLEQSDDFVKGVEEGEVKFGFNGKHDDDFKNDITPDDVRWLMRYLGRVSDAQIRSALRVSGATAEEQDCFTRGLRIRIEQLRQIAEVPSVSTNRERTRSR